MYRRIKGRNNKLENTIGINKNTIQPEIGMFNFSVDWLPVSDQQNIMAIMSIQANIRSRM